MGTGTKIALGIVGAIILVLIIFGTTIAGTYNTLVTLDQATQAQWGQVQNVYQRRADLVPNLVNTVKGAANFEQQTLTAVVQARAKATSIQVDASIVDDPQRLKEFEAAQNQLSGALGHLLAVAE